MRTADASHRHRSHARRGRPAGPPGVDEPRGSRPRPIRWLIVLAALVVGTIGVLLVAAVLAVVVVVNLSGTGGLDTVEDCPDSPVAIHRAAYAGEGAVVGALIDQGHLDDIDNDERTALYCAARGGQVAVVEQLLAAGADPDRRNASGDTPLLWAAQEGDGATVEALLTAGADVDLASDAGHTPLLRAVYGGHAEIVERLLAAGADPDVPGGIDSMEAELLLTGVLSGEPLEPNADPYAEVPVGGISDLPEVTGTPEDGVTALHVAVALGRPDLVTALVAAGATVDSTALDGYTPLHVAALVGDDQSALVLLLAGADPTPTVEPGRLHPAPSPATLAEQMGHPEVAEVIRRSVAAADEG